MPRRLVGIVCDLQNHKDGSRSHRVGDEYVRAVRDAVGADVVLIPATDPPPDATLLDRLDGLLLAGAPSNVAGWRYGGTLPPGTLLDEARDATALPLIAAAIAKTLPVFCICRGFQELNVALGGTLDPDVARSGFNHRENPDTALAAQYAHAHSVAIMPGGILASLLDTKDVRVNSLHSQGIAKLAPGLFVEARAPDGLIEAVSFPAAPGFVLGVQWHPEWAAMSDPVSLRLFSAFARALDSRPDNYGKNGSDKGKIE